MHLNCPATGSPCRYKGCAKGYCRRKAARETRKPDRAAETELKRYMAEALKAAE